MSDREFLQVDPATREGAATSAEDTRAGLLAALAEPVLRTQAGGSARLPGAESDRIMRRSRMQTVKYIHWQEGDVWLGYLEEFPDYWTQGDSLDDLIEHLKDLFLDLSGGQIPGARKVGELVIS